MRPGTAACRGEGIAALGLASALAYIPCDGEGTSVSQRRGQKWRFQKMGDIPYDVVVLLGDSTVGKSNIASQFMQGEFQPDSSPTIGVKPTTKIVQCNSKAVKVNIWDTAGLEKYRAPVVYYNDAVAVMLVYDINKRQSFENAARWLDEARRHGEPGIVFMLVGNKTDLERRRSVTTEEGKKFAKLNKLMFIETSACENSQVELAFQTILNGMSDFCLYA
ncbi:putative GTP-binding protein Drab11 [Fusarium fujikuroi]|nr:putative GTP-binding protein Drab11 [Fusarium fujikuroi]SCO34829.1 probable GTP-binding protein Drab11 [Fusarium fujikuroi]